MSAISRKNKKWDASDDKILMALINEGQNNQEIAHIMGRTPPAITTRASHLRSTGHDVPEMERCPRGSNKAVEQQKDLPLESSEAPIAAGESVRSRINDAILKYSELIGLRKKNGAISLSKEGHLVMNTCNGSALEIKIVIAQPATVPCSFCGAAPKSPQIHGDPVDPTLDYYKVTCQCGASGPHDETETGARDNWNSLNA
jgi:hypothetical protein